MRFFTNEGMGSREEQNEMLSLFGQNEEDGDLDELIALLRELEPNQMHMVYGFIKGFLLGTEKAGFEKADISIFNTGFS